MIVHSARQLRDVCDRLREGEAFGLDTEFVRERTYFIRLGIIQVAGPDLEAILDPQSIEDLAPFLELLSDPEVAKIVHAGEQDLLIFFERNGTVSRNVFDNQIAAALVGYGDQISYARLVEKIAGVRLSKLETLTDWTARPLTPAQISYALEDVRYLLPVRDHLARRLGELGREVWAREELRYLEDPASYSPPPPDEVYKRIKANHLDESQLGVLREVAAWREREAMRRDLPRSWILKDQALIEIARRKPGSRQGLRQIRSLKTRELERIEEELFSAVRRGVSNPVSAALETTPSAKWMNKAEPLTRLLEAWVYARAAESEIAPSMLASREELRTLAAGHLSGEFPSLPVLNGWRRELVGQELLDILSGKTRIAVDSRTGDLTAGG